ncbi:hypothetical protein EN932_22775 [Mesorhizobium sp. M7A.F.Ca.US.002.01.1.1]|uniref:hypothetical protein n=1 Tax=Mesorhizobium sp. M7A.F.Ca.US.002.01.1.1 TaxID=2496700 RepID=UPI000FD61C63|nr:hypothetical protein [Mesorhizobium sp. M7A.F.Ca.US.002.01.1.1]RVA09400.1 hypothetical protein EN932_22775 [Mesorhizobium sp. M7A.F.Ca.US.002.01.1.1]
MKGLILLYLATMIIAFYGWIVNLIDVIHAAASGAPFTVMVIARIVGIPVFGLGAILGWF